LVRESAFLLLVTWLPEIVTSAQSDRVETMSEAIAQNNIMSAPNHRRQHPPD
jgi:hypothetical protein